MLLLYIKKKRLVMIKDQIWIVFDMFLLGRKQKGEIELFRDYYDLGII